MSTESTSMAPGTREKAAEWLVELYTSDNISPILPKFTRWLDEAPEHRREYIYLEDLWRTMDEMRDRKRWHEPVAFTLTTIPHTPEASPRRRWYASPWIYRLAAMLVISFGLGLGAYWSGFIPWDGHYSTGRHSSGYGQQRVLNLSDGSSVTLSGNSQVTLDLSDARRHVGLNRGDALFQVKKNDEVPFEVTAGDLMVRAVGTSFSVRSLSNAVETVVQDGKVLLFANQDPQSPPFPLVAGQVARFENGTIKLQEPAPSRVDARLSWTAGMLSLTEVPLAHVVEEINRHNQRQIEVSADIADIPLSGMFPLNDPDGFAKTTREALDLKYSVSHDPETGVATIHLKGKETSGRLLNKSGDRNTLEKH